jgi:PAS domain S-box-containing protein
MGRPLRVLHVEDSAADAALVERALRNGGFDPIIELAAGEAELTAALEHGPYEVVLADYRVPPMSFADVLGRIQSRDPDVPVLIVSGVIGAEIAAEAVHAGARNVILKSNLSRLVPAVERELRDADRRREQRRNEAALRILSGRLPAVMWTTDLRLRMTYATDAEKYGPLDGKTLFEVFGTDSREHPSIAAHLRALDGESAAFETEYAGRTFQACVNPLREPDGRVVGVIGAALDVGERKAAQDASLRNEQRLNSALDAADLGVWDWDLVTGRIVWAGHHDRIFGFAPGEFDGRYESFNSRVHPEDRDALTKKIQVALRDGTPYAQEFRIVRPDGSMRWIAGRGSAQYDASGRAVRMIGVVADVSDRKAAEQALLESRRLTQAVTDLSPVFLYVFDTGERRSIYVNRNALEFLGHPPGSTPQDIDPLSLMHPDDLARFAPHMEQLQRAGDDDVLEFEYRMRQADGSWRWFFSRDKVFQRAADGRVLQITGAAWDVTDRKRAEAALREAAAGVAGSEGGTAFFEKMTRRLVRLFNADYAFIGLLDQADPQVVNTLATCAGEEIVAPMTYHLRDTPCADVVGQQTCFYPVGVQQRFPKDEVLAQMGIEGYIGTPLFSADGRPLGLIAVLSTEPLAENRQVREILEIFGARAAAELQHHRAEQALRQSEARFRTLVENAPEAVVVCNVDQGRFVDCNENALRMFGLDRAAMLRVGPVELSPPIQPDGRSSTEAAVEYIRATIAGGAPTFEWTHRDAAGREFPCEVALVRLPGSQNLIRGSVTDISARKRSEEAIARSEKQYRDLVETSHDLIWSVDVQGRWTFVNRKGALAVYGYEPEEMLGRPFTEFESEEQSRKDLEVFARIKAGKPVFGYETEHFHKSGRPIVLSYNAIPLLDADGRLLGTTGTARDVTARRQAQEAIARSEKQYRDLVETSHDLIGSVDTQGRWTFVNRRGASAVYGYEPEEMIGRPFTEFCLPEQGGRDMEVLIRVNAGEPVFGYETQHVHKSGRPVFLSCNAIPLRDADGRPLGATGIIRDITARRQADDALRESEARARTVVDSSPMGIFMAAPDGRAVYTNRIINELLGAPPAEPSGFQWAERVHPEDRQDVSTAWRQYVDGARGEYSIMHRVLRADGTARLVHVRAARIQEAERVLGFVGTVEDITDRTAAANRIRDYAERLRVLSRRLLEAQEAERRFIARELHDQVGQSLTAMKLHCQALRQEPSGPAASARLEEVTAALEHTISLVRTLSLELRPTLLDDLGLSAALRWHLDRQARAAGLRVALDAPGADGRFPGPVEVACFRVAQEAVNNVVRHARASSVRIGLLRNNGELHLSIRDDGVGFDPAVALRAAVQGASLGLLSMQERAELAGGRVEFRSSPAAGTEVIAVFPLDGAG